MKMPKPTARALSTFESLLPEHPGVSVRKVFGQPAAFVHGNMFFGVFGDSVFVRLSESDQEEAQSRHDARPFEPMPGRPMRDYMTLPESVTADGPTARRWVRRSLDWASFLPVKGGAKASARPSRPSSAPRREK